MKTKSLRRESLSFLTSASVYWTELFPQARRERARWRSRAEAIPDPTLRAEALRAIAEKWGHSEGAAAFGVLVPRRRRRAFVRMAIAYELMLDYLDNISEYPVADSWANCIQLHRATRNAVALSLPREPDYYLFHPQHEDGGFLSSLVSTCREAFKELPSAAAVATELDRVAAMYSEAQGYCHSRQAGATGYGPMTLVDAAAARLPELTWEEVLAGCNTSLTTFALMVEATTPGRSEAEVARCYSAYFPRTSSLHILMHSLLDRPADEAAGRFNQLGDYDSAEEIANAFSRLAAGARNGLSQLPQGEIHEALLAAVVGYYLASPTFWRGENRLVAERVLAAVGPLARWAMLVHRLRRKDPAKDH